MNDDLTPKVPGRKDPLNTPPQQGQPVSAAPGVSEPVGFTLYDPGTVKSLLAEEAGAMGLSVWPMMEGKVHEMIDRLYARGVVVGIALGTNKEFVAQQLVASKEKYLLPVRVRALPGGVKTERA